MDHAFREQVCEVAIESDLPEADDDLYPRQRVHFCCKVLRAVADLLRSRLVAGRGTSHHRGNPDMAQLQSIFARNGVAVVCKAYVMQYGIHEVARAIARKWPPSAIRSMGPGRKPEYKDSRLRIAKAGNWLRPVGVIKIGTTLLLADPFAVGAKALAGFASDDGGTDILNTLFQHEQSVCPSRSF